MLVSDITRLYEKALIDMAAAPSDSQDCPLSVVRYSLAMGWTLETTIEKLYEDLGMAIMVRILA